MLMISPSSPALMLALLLPPSSRRRAGIAIAEALTENARASRLQTLILDANLMGDNAACAFGSTLATQGSSGRPPDTAGLRTLRLGANCDIREVGAEGIAIGVRAAGRWLELIDFVPNYINEDGRTALRDAAEEWRRRWPESAGRGRGDDGGDMTLTSAASEPPPPASSSPLSPSQHTPPRQPSLQLMLTVKDDKIEGGANEDGEEDSSDDAEDDEWKPNYSVRAARRPADCCRISHPTAGAHRKHKQNQRRTLSAASLRDHIRARQVSFM